MARPQACRFAFIVLLMLAHLPSMLQANICFSSFRQLGYDPDFSPRELKYEIQNGLQAEWKRKIIESIWKGYAKRGYRLVDFGEDTVWLPYVLDVPRDLTTTLVTAALAQGLSRGDRYLIIPAKLLITEGVRKFWKNIFFVLSFGLGKHLLNAVGFLTSDFLVEEGNPYSLAEEEIILIIKLADNKSHAGAGGAAASIMASIIQGVKSSSPEKFEVLDLSNDGGETSLWDRVDELARKLEQNKKRIKKIIVESHGRPGMIYGDVIGLQDLETFGGLLSPLKPHLAAKPEIYLDGCEIAGSEEGRKTVDAFADALLPEGGFIEAHRFFAPAGLGTPDALAPRLANPAYARTIQKVITLANPIWGEGEGLTLNLLASAADRVSSQLQANSSRAEPPAIFQADDYRHTVGRSDR